MQRTITTLNRRRGVSMLELVLALPILLFIMALISNFGVVSAWKVRDLTMARLALWQSRFPRTQSTDPIPDFWPTTDASFGSSAVGSISELDDSSIHQPVVRGPTIDGITVNSDLLDPTLSLHVGTATVTRDYPLLRHLGPYTLTGTDVLLDNTWQSGQGGFPGNGSERIPIIYQLPQAPALSAAYIQAAIAVMHGPLE
jgi:hypothetical protein